LRPVTGRLALAAFAGGAAMAGAPGARAEGIEPRAYSAAPTGVNFLIAGYAYAEGGPSIDSSLPVVDPKLDLSGAILAYARSLDLWGKAAKFDIIATDAKLSGSAIYQGAPVRRDVEGFGDPLARLSVILFGAPTMTPAAFRSYKQDLIVGASLQVSVPLGQYDPTRLVNIGTNRWSFRPEIGISQAVGRWTLEAQAAATVFTENPDFYGGNRRSVSPLYSGQIHAIYNFRSGLWGSLDATYFTGGQTTVNGTLHQDLERNWRVGATLAVPVNRRNSIKFYASSGVLARTGNNFNLIGAAWQYRWGAGL
jgi:hypothetical protein